MTITRTALAVFLATCAFASAASAASVDMHYSKRFLTDPWQVVPLGNDSVMVVDRVFWIGGGLPAVIATPDGSLWENTSDPSRPIVHTRQGVSTNLPALPSNALPSHWAMARDGKLWFTEGFPGNSNRWQGFPDLIGRIDPDTGAVTEFGGLTPGAIAQSIAAGADGNIWFLEFGTNSVGRITPNGAVTEFPLPAWAQLVQIIGQELTTGPGGDLYFTVKGGVARMTTDGVLRPGVINGGLTDFTPNAVAYGRDGNIWATECRGSVTRVSPSGTVTRSPDGTFPPAACPNGMTAGPDGTVWLYEWNTGRAGRVVFDSPLATTDEPTSITATAADLNGEALPRGSATKAHFEYGTTTSYGHTTPPQDIGDGDAAVPVSARPNDLQPLTTYHYRLVAQSVIGTVKGADQTVTTPAIPPPPPPPPAADDDGDGFPVTVDCDDLSAAVYPGARDRPGDRVDQDCSGGDARLPRFQPHADAGWKTVRGRVTFTRMLIDEMPAGSSLKLTCSGPGCNLRAGYSATIAKPVRRLDVTKRLLGAKLRKGAKVELILSRPGYITTVVRWTIGPPPRVSILCRAPGAKNAKAC